MEEGKVDLDFFRRFWLLFKISGTEIFSRISLFLLQTILIALLNAQLLTVYAEWSGESYKNFADITYQVRPKFFLSFEIPWQNFSSEIIELLNNKTRFSLFINSYLLRKFWNLCRLDFYMGLV